MTTIKHLEAKYYNEYGIIVTLIGMFRGSINIQQIAARLLAPFLEHWNPKDKYLKYINKYIIALPLNFLYKVKINVITIFFQYINDQRIIHFKNASFSIEFHDTQCLLKTFLDKSQIIYAPVWIQ